ncbi:MAG: alkaline phosphatase family protein [Planctomycetota bacterium]|nr:MAG: alkaline phosphatase family protein [Planctomycetota bacterium]
MSTPLVVICAVGLTPEHIGPHVPTLQTLADKGRMEPLAPSLPAVTTTGQSSMLTGVSPQEHGIVGNGWYFHDLAEVWLWRQSEALVQAPMLWDNLSLNGKPAKVLKHFWWYAMNTSAQATVTPRPVYHHDGRKSPDCYAYPPELKAAISQRHGTFPLFNFWGPVAGLASSQWIAESFTTAYDQQQPDLSLVYLPHLDYDLQRFGPRGDHLARNLAELDGCIRIVSDHAQAHGARVMVVSEYGLGAVDHGTFINRFLREQGYLSVTSNLAGELLDPGTSRAFAVCDHQLAHVYVAKPEDREAVHRALMSLPGIERCLMGSQRSEWGLDHPRSGDIVCMAEANTWFCYDYWLEDAHKPDFAHCVEIHKKPGYDPRELFFDPRGGKRRALTALIRKKLGLRYMLNPVPLDDRLVRGSHGRPPARPEEGPILICPDPDLVNDHPRHEDVAGMIVKLLQKD